MIAKLKESWIISYARRYLRQQINPDREKLSCTPTEIY